MRSVAKDASIDGSACEIMRTHRTHKGVIKRLALPLVALSDKDAHQLGLSLDLDVSSNGSLPGFRDLRWFGHCGFLEFDHSGTAHLLKRSEQFIDLFLGLNEFDLQREAVRD